MKTYSEQSRSIALNVWLTYYDNPPMTMGDVALELGINRASVRTAVQALVQANLLIAHPERAGMHEHDHWDDPTNAFEEAFPVKTNDVKTTTTNDTGTNIALGVCACGCGLAASKKADYRPGHDARHAGQVGREMATKPEAEWEGLLFNLQSEPLKEKARRVAKKAQAKAVKSATRRTTRRSHPVDAMAEVEQEALAVKTEIREIEAAESDVYTEGSVKVGRWSYPARAFDDGSVYRNTRRDGTGEFVSFDGEMD